MRPVGRIFKYLLHALVNGAVYNLVLLFARKLIEINGITGNSYRKLRIFFGVSLRVQKGFAAEYVYV